MSLLLEEREFEAILNQLKNKVPALAGDCVLILSRCQELKKAKLRGLLSWDVHYRHGNQIADDISDLIKEAATIE